MSTYNVLTEWGVEGNETTGSVSFSPAAVIAVYRRKYPVTFSRKKGASYTTRPSFGVELRDRLIIIDDIQSITVTSNKRNYVTTLSAQLHPGVNYISELLPGDYVFCWMTQTKEAVRDVIKALDKGDPANGWNSGLKFFGKVQNCRKQTVTDATTGTKRVRFALTAGGFTELDASVYFEPYLALPTQGGIAGWMQFFGVAIAEILKNPVNDPRKSNGGISTDTIVPQLFNILYGKGIPKNANVNLSKISPDYVKVLETYEHRITEGLDDPFSFIVPKEVGSVFGVKEGSKPDGNLGWSDIATVIHGVQKYERERSHRRLPGELFNPTIASTNGRVQYTGTPLMGSFMPQLSAFTGQKTVWAILSQFVNLTVNEMYTSLKADATGAIVPTLTIRQLPFSSGLISGQYTPKDEVDPAKRALEREFDQQLRAATGGRGVLEGGLETVEGKRLLNTYKVRHLEAPPNPPPVQLMYDVTRFTELPRWRIPSVMVKSFDVGRSDALRINFVHVYGEAGQKENPVSGFMRNAPIRDDLDIARSGLRPYMATVPCSPQDVIQGGPGAWMTLLADILMNQELTLTGVVNMHGVQAPIVPGDNFEYDGIIAHIEAVNHVFNISPAGTPSFITNIEFSHGTSGEQTQSDDFARFAGLSIADLSSHDPSILRSGPNPTTTSGDNFNLSNLPSDDRHVGATESAPSTIPQGTSKNTPFNDGGI